MIRAQNLCTHILKVVYGAKSRGRPRRRWGEDIKDWTGKTLADCVFNRKRQEELERNCASFCGLRPSATKIENDDD